MTQLVHTCLRNFRLGNERSKRRNCACCCGRQLQRIRRSAMPGNADDAQRSLGRVRNARGKYSRDCLWAQVKCGAGQRNTAVLKMLTAAFHKMPLKTNRIKFKVAVCGQYLGYDRSNEGPVVFLQNRCKFDM